MNREQLIQARKSLGLTQKEMAAALATSLSTYRKWEQGQHAVPGVVEIAVKHIAQEQARKHAPVGTVGYLINSLTSIPANEAVAYQFYTADDVLTLDEDLTDEQVERVIQAVERNKSSEYGITWQNFEDQIYEVKEGR